MASQKLMFERLLFLLLSPWKCTNLNMREGGQKTASDSTPASLSPSEPAPFTLPCPVTSPSLSFQGTLPFVKGTFRAVLWTWAPTWTHHYHVLGGPELLGPFWPHFTNMCGSLETRDLGLPGSDMCLSEQPLVCVSTGQYFWLEPKNAFDNFQEPDIGLIALAFLQGSFAYGGWNFLNYVTEELVDPHKWVTTALPLPLSISKAPATGKREPGAHRPLLPIAPFWPWPGEMVHFEPFKMVQPEEMVHFPGT